MAPTDEGAVIASEELVGAHVQRIDTPRPELVVLGLRWATDDGFAKGHLLIGSGEIVLADERPRGDPVDAFGRRLRKLLTGARLIAIEGHGGRRRVRLERGREERRQTMTLEHEAGQPVLRDREGRPLAGRTRLATREPEPDWSPAAIRRGVIARRPVASPWRKAGRRRAKALQRTIAAVEAEVKRAEQVEALRQQANLLKAHVHAWSPGEDGVDALDFYADPPAPVRLPVDPSRGPSAAADALFHRARRFERGATLGAERLESLGAELEGVEAWLAAAPAADGEERAAWEEEGRALGVVRRDRDRRRAGRGMTPRRPYRRFLGAGDRPILVGRGAADNDQLTLRHARPWDLWLHAKSRRGAHVVVPLEKNEACPPDLLADACMLAAHFSEAHGDTIVEVSYVPRRHVHKRRGDPPGAVRPSREKVLAVRMDPTRVRALLEKERG